MSQWRIPCTPLENARVLFFAVLCLDLCWASDPIDHLRLAEGQVMLTRLHPVMSDNFPEHTDSSRAASLIQTHESRVPHYHVARLRKVHAEVRPFNQMSHRENSTNAASVQTPQASFTQISRHGSGNQFWFDDVVGAFSEQVLGVRAGDNMKDNSDAAVQQASVRMTNLRDSQYVGPLKVGSQGDLLSVVYDTGSTNLWFASTLCREGPCLKRRRYDPDSSSTFSEGAFDLHVTFGTGQLQGQQGIDDVEMGGFRVKQQTFALIEQEQGSIFDQLDFEGILGLAFPSMSANGVTPFFDQVMKQKLLQKNSFSFYFTKLPQDASAVFFGDVDPRLYQGELQAIPVTEDF
eukprot:gnl/MRDRNA2_/MRDRNA2_27029_c0_seq2.p1 gnl/MRDRNA2_/MRDRNA2_27029_c0~~gnl/MRDRNA2_/MRDRNA2_27029_c0_seq2.p1  ORF type:complete len:348 (-),score=44.21 gnl/MRDRNA2_/MRDRNA2_27029_c0_seq2:574-1617(-)